MTTYPPDYSTWTRERQDAHLAARQAKDATRQQNSSANPLPTTNWLDPKPLPDGLLPVAPFDFAFLPDSIAAWVKDISERMQCPPDFVGVAAIIALGSIIGRKIAIRPQRKTDWFETPNLWGCIIGRPGSLKSPAMAEALKPLHRLDAQAREENEKAGKSFAIEADIHKLMKGSATKKIRLAFKDGARVSDDAIKINRLKDCAKTSGFLDLPEPEPPKARRYIVNDCTYEALGVVMADNPNGVLAFRDELVSLLKTLDREDNAAARGLYLTSWNGTSGYTFDRIIRGRIHIDAACLSLLGSTQPGRIAEYIRRASGGAGDDGLIQRFILIWPDQSSEWRNIDRYPDSAARSAAVETFERLDRLDLDAIGCERDNFEPVPYLRFDDGAQQLFEEWRVHLETRLRSNDLAPALESHLAKYRKLVPSLALIFHLADGGTGAVGEAALLRALAFAEYAETHARRCYGSANEAETAAAKALLSRIQRGELADGFTARDVHQKGWAHLSDREQVRAGLELLIDLNWLSAETTQTGGRPRTTYTINPRGRAHELP